MIAARSRRFAIPVNIDIVKMIDVPAPEHTELSETVSDDCWGSKSEQSPITPLSYSFADTRRAVGKDGPMLRLDG